MPNLTVSLPMLDHTGKLSPLVLEALAAGATSANDPADPNGTFLLTFAKAADAEAFRAKLEDIGFDALTGFAARVAVQVDEAGMAFNKLADFAATSEPVEDEGSDAAE